MSTPVEQPSDSRIHLDPAIHPQDSEKQPVATGIDATRRALALLASVQAHQAGLGRSAALAWERVVFAEAFTREGPRERIRAFLEKA